MHLEQAADQVLFHGKLNKISCWIGYQVHLRVCIRRTDIRGGDNRRSRRIRDHRGIEVEEDRSGIPNGIADQEIGTGPHAVADEAMAHQFVAVAVRQQDVVELEAHLVVEVVVGKRKWV